MEFLVKQNIFDNFSLYIKNRGFSKRIFDESQYQPAL